MNAKPKINELETFSALSASTKVLAYDAAANKTGLVNIMSLIDKGHWCGVKWRHDSMSPEGEPIGDLEMLRELPYLLNLGCYIVKNDHSRRKLSRKNHHFYEDGSPAKLDGTEGHYMWGWDKVWYFAVSDDSTYHYVRVAFKPIPGCLNYRVPIASRDADGFSTIDRTNNILVSFVNKTAQFRGGANKPEDDTTWKTGLGKPACSTAANLFEKYAEKNGPRFSASHYLMNTATAILGLMVFHNRDIQADFHPDLDGNGLHYGGLGRGCSYEEGFGYYGYVPKGTGAELGDALGIFEWDVPVGGPVAKIKGIPNFFGLKNWYHNMTTILHGVLFRGTGTQHDIFVQPRWTEEAIITDNISGMSKIGAYVGTSGEKGEWVYPKSLNLEKGFCWVKEEGGSTSTGYCDAQYLEPASTTGVRAPGALLDAGYGGLCGPFAFLAYCTPASSGVYYGAFLCEAKEDWDATPSEAS